MDLETYEKSVRLAYAALADVVADILAAAIRQHGDLRLQHIQRRAKAPASLRRKLEKQGALDSPEIEAAAKDLAGVRVILYTNADVTRLLSSSIIRDNFDVDWNRTKFHHPPQDPEDAAELFISNNYVVTLKDERTQLPEYARFAGMSCEVQVQTTLNHAWSEMAHDTIYKKPELSGFGGDLMRQIENRMKSIMQKYLLPAGHEFQKVLIDAERLASGKEFFDRGALTALNDCADNNERHDVLERFVTYVLPHYDDYTSLTPEILSSVAQAVREARQTQQRPIETPFSSLPGRKPYQIAILAQRVVDYLRYADIRLTLQVLSDLYQGAVDPDERTLWLKSIEALAQHDLKVWERVGPRVQTLVVEHLSSLAADQLLALRLLVLVALKHVLQSDVSGSTLTDYRTIALHHGAVVTSHELRTTRAAAIDLLMNLFGSSANDSERRDIIPALQTACSTPGFGQPSATLLADILLDARRIVEFYATLHEISFELRQEIEHDLYWMHRRNRSGEPDEDALVSDRRTELLRAIVDFRDRVNANREFVIYKTLVGFESVFPPAWDDPEFYHADDTYRNAAIEKLVAEVTPETADPWLNRIRRCAATESNDLATFPPFGRFLSALGQSKPELMAAFIEQADERLARFLTSMLSGLVGTTAWPSAEATVTQWIRERRHLSHVAWSFRSVGALPSSLLSEILEAAIETHNDEAVVNLVAAAAARYDTGQEGILKQIALSGIRYLGAEEDLRWVNALILAQRPERSAFLLALDEAEASELLDQLVSYPRIEYQSEDLITALAARWSVAVIEFFGKRLRREHVARRQGYDAIPYQFHRLNAVLAPNVDEIVATACAWFDEDRSFFEYRGAKLITGVFPAFSDQLEALLLQRISTGSRDEIAFVLGILRAYNGQPFLHRLCKEIVAVLSENDELLDLVAIVLDATGVTTGEFGRVTALQEKSSQIEPWLEDPRERVREFARRHRHGLHQQIAAARRRSEEDLALRKLEYGASAEDDNPAAPE